MLTIESLFHSSHFVGQLRTIVEMSTSQTERKTSSQQSLPDSETSTGTACMAASQRRQRGVNIPQAGSLYHIMCMNSDASLYVLPIVWTDMHARLLGARFNELPPILSPSPADQTSATSSPAKRSQHPRPSRTAIALGRELTTLLSTEITRPFCKSRAIKIVLSTFYPDTLSRPRSAAELDLWFGGRVFRKAIRIPVLWRHPDSVNTSFDSADTRPASSFSQGPSSSWHTDRSGTGWSGSSGGSSQSSPNQPMLAYINRWALTFIRSNLFRIVPGPEDGDRSNIPVSRLQQLRSKLLLPSDVDKDAHLIGVLLAMAQAHFYSETTSRASSQSSRSGGRSPVGKAPTPEFRDTKVQLITHADDTADFVVYTATVSASFLRLFAEPFNAPLDPSGLTISYTKVPIWPILGLKERLGKALGRDIAGDISQNGGGIGEDFMETWETQEEREQRISTLKRRRVDREALAEVLNRSFEVENDVEGTREPALSPSSKRRCTNPVMPLGEVC